MDQNALDTFQRLSEFQPSEGTALVVRANTRDLETAMRLENAIIVIRARRRDYDIIVEHVDSDEVSMEEISSADVEGRIKPGARGGK